ncbi:MAG: RHS repeat-associated core domain-containing protein, partial [Bacteroidota bacterium]
MGCPKITYDAPQGTPSPFLRVWKKEGVEASPVYFYGVLIKKGGQQKNREDYYPYGLTFNEYKRTGLDKNEYLYQGKEEMEGTDWYDFHARSYHAGLGRFMSVDPKYNGPSPYVGMNNNPISTIDPDGEEPITIITAIAIGAAVSAASYTASVALSDGGFNNWDWGQFGKQVAIGAVSGAVTAGIGTAFQTTYGAQLSFGQQVLKSALHAHVQGSIAEFTGGDYLTSAASGFAGGVVGGQAARLGNIGAIGSSMLLGGTIAELQQEGEFWRGAAVAGIVAGANDVAHRLGESLQQRITIKRLQKEGLIPADLNTQEAGELIIHNLRKVWEIYNEEGVSETISGDQVVDPESMDWFAQHGSWGGLATQTKPYEIAGQKVYVNFIHEAGKRKVFGAAISKITT